MSLASCLVTMVQKSCRGSSSLQSQRKMLTFLIGGFFLQLRQVWHSTGVLLAIFFLFCSSQTWKNLDHGKLPQPSPIRWSSCHLGSLACQGSQKQIFDWMRKRCDIVEWSKSRAWKMQWEEEVQIIQEKMQRTIVYYEWKEQWWLGQNPEQTTIEDTIQHIHKSNHIIASAWLGVLRWLGYLFCNQRV